MSTTRAILVAMVAVLAGCATVPTPDHAGPTVLPPMKAPPTAPELERGKASWYGPGFQGRRTANGERFDMNALTAAHRTLPFGTLVRVRNDQNGREVVVRINDRGPYVGDRIIDLSRAAAAALGLLQTGEGPVILMGP